MKKLWKLTKFGFKKFKPHNNVALSSHKLSRRYKHDYHHYVTLNQKIQFLKKKAIQINFKLAVYNISLIINYLKIFPNIGFKQQLSAFGFIYA